MHKSPLLAILISGIVCAQPMEYESPDGMKVQALAPDPVPQIRFSGFIDDKNVNQVLALMQAAVAMKASVLILELDTPGGEVGAGFRFAKAVEDMPIPVVCVVDGEADSMGFYVLQSCRVRVMTRRSSLMAHYTYFGRVEGALDVNRLRELMQELITENAGHTEHECRRLTIPLADCRAKIKATWWMSWKQAQQVGAVDAVVTSVEEVRAGVRAEVAAQQP